MPQNMDNNTITDYRKRIKLLTILLVSSMLAIIALIGLFAYQSKFSKPAESFEITNVNNEVLRELENNIVFTGADRTPKQLFYSPSLQLKLYYDSNIFNVYDYSTSVSISPINMQRAGFLRILETSDVRDHYLDEYSYVDGFALEEEKEENGIKYLLFKYEEPSQLDETKKRIVYMTVFSKVLENSKTAHIEIREFDYRKNNLTPDFVKVLTSVSTDISDVNKDAKSVIGDGLVTVSYDLDSWGSVYQGDNSMTIELIDHKKFGITKFNVSITKPYLPEYEGKDVAETMLSEELDFQKEYNAEYNYELTVLYENQEKEIGGITFKELSYEKKHKTYEDYPTIYSYAVAFLPNSEQAITIETYYDSQKPEALDEFKKIYENIIIIDKQLFSGLQSTPNSNVLGTNSVVLNSATILAQASTVRLLVEDCIKATFAGNQNPDSKLAMIGKTYNICVMSFGTGFAIDNNGHFVTNAHVANSNMTDTFVFDSISNESYLKDFLATMETLKPGSTTNIKNKEDFLGSLYWSNAYFKETGLVTLTKDKTTIYIQGNEPFEFDQETYALVNKEKHIEAQVVDAYEMDSVAEALYNDKDYVVTKPDLALIKIPDSYRYPNLVATSVDSIPGEGVFVIGYPGISDNKYIFGSSSKVNSTVTGGVISALRDSSMNNYKLLQIDASVDHGNSGGPIINSAGNFIGVATYGLGASDSGNYNAGVYYSSVLELLSKNGVINSENNEREILASALTHIENSYYKLALTDLNKIKSVNANIPNVIDPLITLSESKIAEGQDQTPWIVTDFLILPNWALLLIIGLLLILFVAVALIVMFLKKRKTEQAQQQTTTSPQSTSTPTETVQQPVTTQPQTSTEQIQQSATPPQPTNTPIEIAQPQTNTQPIQQPTTPPQPTNIPIETVIQQPQTNTEQTQQPTPPQIPPIIAQ